MAGEVARLCKLQLANVAFERLLPRVGHHVALQVARLGKLLAASVPRALVRFLPRVGPHVPIQGRAVREDLLADRTEMRLSNLQALREVCI